MAQKTKDGVVLRRLTTAKEVVEVLGGIDKVCEMTGNDYKTVYHWTGRSNFPARYHDMMTKALRRHSARAPPHLWNQQGVKAA